MSSRLPKRTPRGIRQRRRVAAGPEAFRQAHHACDWLGDDRLFTPLGHEPGYDYPLLIWLPNLTEACDAAGASDSSEAPIRRGFDLGRVMKQVSLRNFVAVQPVLSGDKDRGLSLDEAVWRTIERVSDRIAIHQRRIFLVGHQAGGSDAFRIACRHPREFAGVISLGGSFPLDEALFSQLADVRRLPMLFCCQRENVLAQAAQTDRMLRLFHAAGASLAMRIYPGDNDLSRSVLVDVNRWIMDEVCGTPAAVHSLSAS